MEDFIIFSLDDEPPSSPPRLLLPLMLTCRRFHKLLHPDNNPRLYRRIFHRKFDGASLARRFPHSSVDDASRFFPELGERFRALRCIRTGDIHHPDLEGALLRAYIMVLEHDKLNHQLLLDVSLPALLDRYINERLHRGHNVWPIEDTCNTLAVALFWHMTSQDALNGESIGSRERTMDIILPLAFAWFRYSFAEQGFDPYTFVHGSSSTSPHSHPEVPPPPVTVPINFLGHEFHLRLPPIALSASLAYFARLFPLTHPPYREQGQIDGPTVEGIDEYNLAFRTRTVPRGPGFPDNNLPIGGLSPSACHDWDWLRNSDQDVSGSVGRYTPGTLAGKWRGTILAPYDRDFTRFFMPGDGPASIPEHSPKPFSCTLEEHVRYSTPMSCPSGHEWDDPSFIPAFPPSTWTQRENGIELSDEQSSTKVFYTTFNCERPGEEPENVQSHSAKEEIVDVILSGRTEPLLQSAWGNYEFWGRVRISDGLVVLVRQLPDVPGGRPRDRRIYAGYVLSSQNFVGKWKYCSPDAQWEGIWSLCKAE